MSATPSAGRGTAIGMLMLANLFWALSFPLSKTIMLLHQELQPNAGGWFVTTMVLAPRFLLAVLLLLAFAGRVVSTATPAERCQGFLLGLATAGGMLWQIDGLQYTSASTSAFLSQLYAVMIPVWVALRTRQRPPPLLWLCCGLMLAGSAVLARFDPRSLQLGRGEAETLVAAVFFMGQVLLLSPTRFPGNRALPVTAVMFGTEAVVFSVLALGLAPQPAAVLVPWAAPAWLGGTLLLAVFCALGAFLLMTRWQPLISPTEAGLIYCLVPVFTALLALFLPALFSQWTGIDYVNERVTWHLLVGGTLVIAANVLLQWRPLGPEERQ